MPNSSCLARTAEFCQCGRDVRDKAPHCLRRSRIDVFILLSPGIAVPIRRTPGRAIPIRAVPIRGVPIGAVPICTAPGRIRACKQELADKDARVCREGRRALDGSVNIQRAGTGFIRVITRPGIVCRCFQTILDLIGRQARIRF